MEIEILETIVDHTRQKLLSSDTELNILDLLQTYDNYISKDSPKIINFSKLSQNYLEKNKISIDLKTKVYKGLLKWSRENLQSSQNTSESNSLTDIEHDLRFSSPKEKGAAKETKISYEPEEIEETSEILIQHSLKHQKRMTLPKLNFDEVIQQKELRERKNTLKPPTGRRKASSKMHKSTEKPLQNYMKEGEGRISTQESSKVFEKHHTPNFRGRGIEILDNSPYMEPFSKKNNRNSQLSTTNDKDSFENIRRSSENKLGQRFSELLNSYESEEIKEESLETNFQNEEIAISY